MKTLYMLLTIVCLAGFQFGCSPDEADNTPIAPTTTPETPSDAATE